jgi:hypothetical protein
MSTWLLQIAGSRTLITLGAHGGIPWPDHYRDFVSRASGDVGATDLTIEIHATDKPAEFCANGAVEFSSNGWCLIHKEPTYRFGQGANPGSLFAVAKADAAFRTVELQLREGTFAKEENLWTVPELTFLPLLRVLVMYFLLLRDRGVVLHASGLTIDGRAFLFLGRSGAGKTTLSRLFLSRQDRCVLSDDRMIACKSADGFTAWGTPWPGDLGVAVNQSAPLKGIFFLHKSDASQVRAISARQALDQLLAVVSIPWYDRKLVATGLQLCEQLLAQVPLYELHFRPDEGVVDTLRPFVG